MLIWEKPFDIFAVSETWLNTSILDSELSLAGYTLIRQDRKNRSGGGTTIYLRDGIAYLHRKNVSDESSEICWIEMCWPKCKKQFIYFFYKPPTFCSDLLINDLNQGLVNIPFDSEIIIFGN